MLAAPLKFTDLPSPQTGSPNQRAPRVPRTVDHFNDEARMSPGGRAQSSYWLTCTLHLEAGDGHEPFGSSSLSHLPNTFPRAE